MTSLARSLQLLAAAAASCLGAALVLPATSVGAPLSGGTLSFDQRDVRVHNNFTSPSANDNTLQHPSFPGQTGAALAIWKAAVEWGSGLHGDGQGDPSQPGGLGSAGSNFSPSWQGQATGIGGFNDNVHSEIAGDGGGVLAYCETPISDGWRIRYFSNWTWDDGPLAPALGQIDIQGVATHEFGHAMGLGHSGDVSATMYPTISGPGTAQRSIETADKAAAQGIYGPADPAKPRITQSIVNAQVGTVTLQGVNFAPTGNEVWFTAGGPTSPSSDPIVRVAGVASTGGGTSIQLSIPAAAGPGDVLVRLPASGHAALSNAWPLDPFDPGSAFGPPVVTSIAPTLVPSVANGPNFIDVAGTGFSTLNEVRLSSVLLDPSCFQVLGDDHLQIDIPLQPVLGPIAIELTNDFGTSAPTVVSVTPPDPPVLTLDSVTLFSASGVQATVGAEPGKPYVLAGSLLLQPTVVTGVVHADIGGQFQSLIVLGCGAIDAPGWTRVGFPISGLPFATAVYFQAAILDPGTGATPWVVSNVAGGTYYY